MKLHLNIKRVTEKNIKDEIYKIGVSGDLNFSNYEEFSSSIDDLIQKGIRKIIIDLSKLASIDSVGMSVLIKNQKNILKEKGEMIITGCREQILDLLLPINFDRLIKFFSNYNEGLDYLSNNRKKNN